MEPVTLGIAAESGGRNRLDLIELTFPFDQRVTPTTVLASTWDADGSLHLPAIQRAGGTSGE
jgi:hypothetical protein